jgi:hypothetical protein
MGIATPMLASMKQAVLTTTSAVAVAAAAVL